ncbi:MAG: precorrin-4 C(11)-methyltransferase [Victivallaceae bacterium]|nr:precorrin-4 C(11)-methyltransferase [Victivallaceae bacterium]
MQGKVVIAGAGPGAADLITLRAVAVLKSADLVIYAGSLVNPDLLNYAPQDAIKLNSAAMSLDAVIAAMKQAVAGGKNVVRLHTGDPAMYGAISEQMNELDELGIDYEVIPGVSSVFAAAAALKAELTMPGITQTAILTRRAGRTPVPEQEEIVKLANNNASVALFLSIADMPGLVNDFMQAGRAADTPVAVVYRASWPNQQIVRGTLANISVKVQASGIKRQAMIIVGAALARGGEKSLLYAHDFAHGYRSDDGSKTFAGKVAIYAITEQGSRKAGEVAAGLAETEIFIPERFADNLTQATTFAPKQLMALVRRNWRQFDAHLFIMAAGIVVRKIAGLLESKLTDPAVVVCDELGNNSISLLSGHIGGANRLATVIAGITGGRAIITTATDINNLTAFDELAAIKHWQITNPQNIKIVNSMLLEGKNIDILMPETLFKQYYQSVRGLRWVESVDDITGHGAVVLDRDCSKVAVPVLKLKSMRYAVGIGCRKATECAEIEIAFNDALQQAGIEQTQVVCLASSDIKSAEPGLLKFAEKQQLELKFYDKASLNAITTPNPTPRAIKEFGVASVSEAAAILAANNGKLVIEKQKYAKVTIAVAKF